VKQGWKNIIYIFCMFSFAQASNPITPIIAPQNLNVPLVQLGEMLFSDPRLSRNDNVSCASCHILANGGVDNLSVSPGTAGRLGITNTPTVFNSALNHLLFIDGRAKNLTEQINFVLENDLEFDSRWSEIIPKLTKDDTYQKLFRALDLHITETTVKQAIVEFEKSLVTLNSPFDNFLNGDESAISEKAKLGYSKFTNLGCIACHQGANIGGNLFSKLGVFEEYPYEDLKESACFGKQCLTGKTTDRGLIRVPSLRLSVLTAPYLHDGSIETIEKLIYIMGRYQLGQEIDKTDIEHINAFLQTLVGQWNSTDFSIQNSVAQP